jgi:polyhydroxyalkanoate synthase
MMRLPDALPMHLMLAMMQSGILPNAWMPWSVNSALFIPEWMRPKSPLEQSVEQLQRLWQNASDEWLDMFAPSEKHPARNKASSSRRTPDSLSFWPEMPDFGGMADPGFLTSLSQEAFHRSTGFLQGIQAYLTSDYERPAKEYDVLWQQGSARLFDLAPEATDAVAVLCVPSLINRSTILDLYPEVSFVEYLKRQGFRPLILDWGSPNKDECEFAMADYIQFYALDALHALRLAHDGPIALVGYCMGGIFATAMAQLAAREVDALVLLATPWDFSSSDAPVILLNPATQAMLRQWIMTQYPVQPIVTQTIFHLIDPWRVQEKFSRFPTLSEAERQHFLAVEQWVNDGVPLPNKVAEECFVDWPQGNILARHQWKVGRRWIEAEQVNCPALAIIPTKDAIVPSGCALPLTKLIRRCEVLMPECGHVSMIVGKHAPKAVWEPLVAWLRKKF